jgi:hypothetical protein
MPSEVHRINPVVLKTFPNAENATGALERQFWLPLATGQYLSAPGPPSWGAIRCSPHTAMSVRRSGTATLETAMRFMCPHCGGRAFRLLKGIDGEAVAECLNCGKAFEQSMLPGPVETEEQPASEN